MKNLSLKNLWKNNKKKKKGFTLVELIIVIAIMAILAAVSIPKFGEITQNANKTADIATAKNIHGVAAQILADNPRETDLTNLVGARMDGGAMPESKVTGDAFTVNYNTSGDIEVYAGSVEADNQVYPTQGTKFQKAN